MFFKEKCAELHKILSANEYLLKQISSFEKYKTKSVATVSNLNTIVPRVQCFSISKIVITF